MMGRLTKRAGGTVVYAGGYKQYEGGDIPAEVSPQGVRELLVRLAEYEDTGLTPEQCAEYAKADREGRYIVLRDAEQEGVKRLRELAEADKDGRVTVLPCKVGDTVYLIVTKRARNYTPEFRFVKKSRLTFLNMERILQDFGKEAFLTREEAEKTLEAMK